MGNLFNTKDHTEEFDKEDIKQNRETDISWLVLIPIFAAKDSKWAKFHANNGLLLAIAEIAVWIVFGLLGMIPYVGWLFWALNGITSLALTGLMVFGIVNAARGRAKELPIIGDKIKILK